MGEINRFQPFYNTRPAIGIVYRRNYNPFYSAKASIIRGELSASDKNFDASLYQVLRNAKIDNVAIYDLSLQLEFNFLEISKDKKGNKFSPYFNVGLALFYAENIDNIQLAIPFGLGVKYKISPKFELGLEWSYRKTFTDKLDGISEFSTVGLYEYKQQGQINNNDWYSFVGINILYNLAKKKRCPVYN